MNSNLFHNVANIGIAVVAGATAFMLATGCTALPTGSIECSQSWVDPTWSVGIVTGLALLKSTVNVVRDGFSGLFKKQPPVE